MRGDWKEDRDNMRFGFWLVMAFLAFAVTAAVCRAFRYEWWTCFIGIAGSFTVVFFGMCASIAADGKKVIEIREWYHDRKKKHKQTAEQKAEQKNSYAKSIEYYSQFVYKEKKDDENDLF